MRVALVNPRWDFANSIYFGCREPHLPLELGYSQAMLQRAGHTAAMIDAHLFDLGLDDLAREVAAFGPDMTVITTAPTYLFWRCAPPELRVPIAAFAALRQVGGTMVAVGPHGSATPRAALAKLGADVVVMGECEETVTRLAGGECRGLAGIAVRDGQRVRIQGGPQAARFVDARALGWPAEWLERHPHHHHRFDREGGARGAEVEASRGCPYRCTFCAKENFRNGYRRRELGRLLAEIDGLLAQGVEYLYFIDEIFLPDRNLLAALAERGVAFGVQTRLDLWKPEMIELLGRAGCVSIEAGVESLTAEGRDALAKNCRLDTEALTERLILAKQHVAFVQGNLIGLDDDEPERVAQWRDRLRREGVWANDPVPLFCYPGSPDYGKRWGAPDDLAWERAHAHYVGEVRRLSDLQDSVPMALPELEALAAQAPR
jgi:B12-binding domain/radical SAM domain protein of rhizo-twelve system